MNSLSNLAQKCFILLLFFISACTLSQGNRDNWQQPEKVMDVLGIKQGMIIGEAGAGDGYFTIKMAERLNNTGKIYANDIDEDALNDLRDKCNDNNFTNVEIIVGKITDPLFPDNSLDLVIMVYVFHDLSDPVPFIQNIIPSLKPGAPLIILDRDPDKYGGEYDHFYTKSKTKDLMSKTDFKLDKIESFLERDNIYIYRLDDKNERSLK